MSPRHPQLTEESPGMATYDALMDERVRGASWGEGPWLRSPSWDLGLFPMATYKFIHGAFYIGDTQLLLLVI